MYPVVLQVTVASGGAASGLVRVRVAGDVDENSAPVLAAALRDVTGSEMLCVEVDVSAVTFFSSAGVDALLTARQAAGGRLTVTGAGRAVRHLSQVWGLEKAFGLPALPTAA